MSNHTPAPWFYVQSSDKRSDGYVRMGKPTEDGRHVAICRVSELHGAETRHANGTLLAASPELLVVVERFLRASEPGASPEQMTAARAAAICLLHDLGVVAPELAEECERCEGTGIVKFCPSEPDKCSGCEEAPCPECGGKKVVVRRVSAA